MTSNTTRTDFALGVDIGGTNSVYGLCDSNGNIRYETSVSTKTFETAGALVEAIYDDLAEREFIDSIIGIGIGAPNANFYSGNIEFAPNLDWKGKTPIAHLFEQKFDLPTIVTNDANAAALGEMIYGNARDLSHFVTITLGTGLGSGIIIDGKLVYGHDGFAGEYGHVQVVPNGRLCGCGRTGCLETYVSATGVVRSIKELESPLKASSKLIERSDINAHDVFDIAKAGDPFAKEIIDYTATILGKALANFTCFSSPKAYVLFGGIAQSGDEFAVLVKAHMEENMLNIYQNKVEIRISSLHDVNAAVLGASSLVWNERKKYE